MSIRMKKKMFAQTFVNIQQTFIFAIVTGILMLKIEAQKKVIKKSGDGNQFVK